MTGIIALQGGGPFVANDPLDARLLAAAPGSGPVVVLPTADAFERPERLVAAALEWAGRLGAPGSAIEVQGLMVLRRSEANDPAAAATVRGARAVYLVGDQPLHLRSVLKETPVWQALHDVLDAGGTIVGVGGSAAALCDPMVDPRGGAFTLGLGLVPGMALVTEAESWSKERLHRTLGLANTPVAVLASGTALVRAAGGGWERVGEVQVTGGELPG
jgi:cyanophycinase